MALTIDELRNLCRDAAAIRRVTRLQPAGGAGDKLYPPTYEGGYHAKDVRVIEATAFPACCSTACRAKPIAWNWRCSQPIVPDG